MKLTHRPSGASSGERARAADGRQDRVLSFGQHAGDVRTIGAMSVTVQLPAEALHRLEAEAARRGISIDDVIAELAYRLPDAVPPSGHRLSFIGVGTSGDTRAMDVRSERAGLAERKRAEGI